MSAGDFVRALDAMVRRPHITAGHLAQEEDRLGIAQEEGERQLVDRLVKWLERKDDL